MNSGIDFESKPRISFAGYDFHGPVMEPENLASEQGVYVVLCLVSGKPHCVLDVCTAEGGASGGGNIRKRLARHNRRRCWHEHCHGTIAYAAYYVSDVKTRLNIEDELRWKMDPPCGVSPWTIKLELCPIYEQKFGPKGSLHITPSSSRG